MLSYPTRRRIARAMDQLASDVRHAARASIGRYVFLVNLDGNRVWRVRAQNQDGTLHGEYTARLVNGRYVFERDGGSAA